MNDGKFYALFCAKKKGAFRNLVSVSQDLTKLEALMRNVATAQVVAGGAEIEGAQIYGWPCVLSGTECSVYPRYWIVEIPGIV